MAFPKRFCSGKKSSFAATDISRYKSTKETSCVGIEWDRVSRGGCVHKSKKEPNQFQGIGFRKITEASESNKPRTGNNATTSYLGRSEVKKARETTHLGIASSTTEWQTGCLRMRRAYDIDIFIECLQY